VSAPDIRPPSDLGAAGRAFWRELTRSVDFDVHELPLVRLACEAHDRREEARELLKVEGLVCVNEVSGAQKAHPAIGVEQSSARLVASLLRQLAIPPEAPAARKAQRTRYGNPRRPRAKAAP
jgi:phage terminase small subunit